MAVFYFQQQQQWSHFTGNFWPGHLNTLSGTIYMDFIRPWFVALVEWTSVSIVNAFFFLKIFRFQCAVYRSKRKSRRATKSSWLLWLSAFWWRVWYSWWNTLDLCLRWWWNWVVLWPVQCSPCLFWECVVDRPTQRFELNGGWCARFNLLICLCFVSGLNHRCCKFMLIIGRYVYWSPAQSHSQRSNIARANGWVSK